LSSCPRRPACSSVRFEPLLEFEPALPPLPPLLLPPLALSTRTVPCMFGWIVQV
jgi:hypothetical protein